jgi:DNA-3-methyladenine glycosylase I
MAEKKRCAWCTSDPLYVAYHDEEWGVPLHDARKLFEMIILEGAQAGLSWLTILRRREGYRRFLELEKEPGGFDRFLWNFVGGKPQARPRGAKPRNTSPEAEAMSAALKVRGFRFVGPTICYAFMQAVGMVNDHAADCFRRTQVARGD